MRAQPRPPARPAPWGDAGLVSGEAVELDVRAARIGSRVLALLLDVLAQAALMLVLSMSVGVALLNLPDGLVDGALAGGIATVGLILVLVGYPVLCERFNHGRTLGKMAVGLRVVSADGAPVAARQSLIRALVGVAVEWPGLVLPLVSWVAGVTVMVTDRRGRRLGDLVAGTLVVHTRTATAWRPVPTAVPALAGWAGAVDLSRLDDGLALAARQYLARVHHLAEPARARLGHGLWTEISAVITPPPPPGMPESVYLAAVLGERHRRARYRLGLGRSAAATLWPELTLHPPAPPRATPSAAGPAGVATSEGADGPDSTARPAGAVPPGTVRPAVPVGAPAAVPIQPVPGVRPAVAPAAPTGGVPVPDAGT
ncbi:RDD family protein [Micromonospora sp. DSM 115977]|uniref:RDD family protein n=1 Tax=Micromonospora reichwaldensis TaxID=3075516 RepID=A0ABU2X2M3_9ACTN|nr:RDD family protein [Micromonospora sp. DSM 115977]MDT0532435.1 RDD family protein [Micromonospora sp. DSM 115977]